MAQLLPLHSITSAAEIERRARALFKRGGSLAGHDLDRRLRAEADHFEDLRSGWMRLPPDGIPRLPPRASHGVCEV